MTKSVIILSGGLDSTTLLYDILNKGHEVFALSFDYNQKHKKELKMAEITCKKLNINHKIVDITSINQLLQGSALTTDSIEIPEGHYEQENMKQTVVPNRNMILLSLAVGYAISLKADKVYYGAHAGDHIIYPDTRPEFVEAMKNAIQLADWHKIELVTPYINIDKGDIVKKGIKLNVPYENTWTCYKGEEEACGKCGSCIERLESFKKAGVKDPIKYQGDINE